MKKLLFFGSLLAIFFAYSFSLAPEKTLDLRYDQITFKASHNSYERNESISNQLTFNPGQTYNSGVMALEFDIWRHSSSFTPGKSIDKGYFTVAHTTPGNTTLSSYLSQVKSWHNANPNHLPILITLDIKSSRGGYSDFHDEIDTYLACFFGANLIFNPEKLMANSSRTLAQNVIADGWPTLSSSALRGKFIFCLSGNKDWKTQYANTNLTQRLCFSDQDKSDNDINVRPPTTGNFVFFNFHIYDSHRATWLETIPRFAQSKFITRAYLANSETNFNNCIRANVSAIATDKIRNHSWAKVSNSAAYTEKIPANDKRSIKNTGNNEYRTDRATKMQGNYESPKCTFFFEKQSGTNIYALRNAKNSEYLDCSITSMSSKINDNCQRWELIAAGGTNRYYVRNVSNRKYLTKSASKLTSSRGSNEIHILQPR